MAATQRQPRNRSPSRALLRIYAQTSPLESSRQDQQQQQQQQRRQSREASDEGCTEPPPLDPAPEPPSRDPELERERIGYVMRWRGRIKGWKPQWFELKDGFLRIYEAQHGKLLQAVRIAFCTFGDIDDSRRRHQCAFMEINATGKAGSIVITTESLWQLHDWQEALIRAQQFYFLQHWTQREQAKARRKSVAQVRVHR